MQATHPDKQKVISVNGQAYDFKWELHQAQIESILSQASEFSETERCLSPNQFRNIQILGDRYLLFEGRGSDMWLNTLLHRCPGLRRHSVLGMERMSV